MSAVGDRYDRLAGEFLRRIEETPMDRWDAPSPCEGWSAREVVAHVVVNHRMITDGALSGHFAPPGSDPRPDMDDTDLAAAFDECRRRFVALLDDPAIAQHTFPAPIGLVTLERAADVIGVLELLVHTWDLARTVGGDEKLDEEAVAATYEAIKPHYDALQATDAFLPRIAPPPGADVQTEFLCFLGRRP
jgi:uncharacterized protein (TIGR03086 family)